MILEKLDTLELSIPLQKVCFSLEFKVLKNSMNMFMNYFLNAIVLSEFLVRKRLQVIL